MFISGSIYSLFFFFFFFLDGVYSSPVQNAECQCYSKQLSSSCPKLVPSDLKVHESIFIS